MKKVRLKFNEYMATLPPYRFAAGDVIEIDDAWADQIVQRGIARKAPSNAQTVQEIRAEERGTQEETASVDREARRRALQDQLAAIDREDAAQPFGGHYSDMITREDTGDDPADSSGKPPRRGRRSTAVADPDEPGDDSSDDGKE